MKSIISHIEYLLQRSDCLILPGIGALITEYIPARIDEQEGVIYPPQKRLSLNSAIRHDDGMLATSIARTESIKFEEARLVMQDMLDSLRDTLNTEGEVSLGRIGILKLNSDNTVNLISFRTPEQIAADLGLGIAPLRSINVSTDNIEVAPLSGTTDQTLSENPDIEMRPFSRKNYYIPINKIFAKCAASVVVLTIVALSFIMPQRNVINERISASMNPVETLMSQSGTQRDITAYPPNSLSDQDSDTTQPEDGYSSTTEDAEIVTTTPASNQNYLIVATFKTRQEAETFIEMRKGGRYPLSAVKGKNVWRISAGEGDRETLRNMLNTSEFQSAFAETWIWCAD